MSSTPQVNNSTIFEFQFKAGADAPVTKTGVRLAILRFSISGEIIRKVLRSGRTRVQTSAFSAGSILTLRKRIEPLASTTSLARTPRKMQSAVMRSQNSGLRTQKPDQLTREVCFVPLSLGERRKGWGS